MHLTPLAAEEEEPELVKLRAALDHRIGEAQLPDLLLQNETAWQLGEKGNHLRPSQLLAQSDLASSIDAVNLKYDLCQIDTNLGNVHPGRSCWIKWLLDTSTLAQLMPLKAGASMPLLLEAKMRRPQPAVELFDQVEGLRDVRVGPYLWCIYAAALLQAGDPRVARLWAQKALDSSQQYDAPASASISRARALVRSVH